MAFNPNTIETVLLFVIIVIQIIVSFFLIKNIIIYWKMFHYMPAIIVKMVPQQIFNSSDIQKIISYPDFPTEPVDNDDDEQHFIETTVLQTHSNNKVFKKIVEQINGYLINNRGATIDFQLIKDITDRNVEGEDDNISSWIPAPLYLGLTGTMIGIIAGLWGIDLQLLKQSTSAAATNFPIFNMIEPLINGVKYAMIVSVIGLLITTIFSVLIYNTVSHKVQKDKNHFLSKLLSDLLPKLNRSKLPEVEILSHKLDVFARNTTDAITKFNEIVKNSSNAIQYEQQLIADIKKLDVSRITAANVKMFRQLEDMMGSFENFAQYYNKLNKSMSQTSDLLANLKEFVTRTNHINEVLTEIKNIVGQSKEATDFFNRHIKSFAQYNDAVNETVATNDSVFKKAMDELNFATLAQIESYNTVVSDYDNKMAGAFDNSIRTFTTSMDDQVLRAEIAYDKNRPKFEKLEQLDKLDSIEKRLEELDKQLSNSVAQNINKLISAMSKFTTSNRTDIEETNGNGQEKVKKNPIVESVLSGLTVGAYLVIITIGVYTILRHFNLVS